MFEWSGGQVFALFGSIDEDAGGSIDYYEVGSSCSILIITDRASSIRLGALLDALLLQCLVASSSGRLLHKITRTCQPRVMPVTLPRPLVALFCLVLTSPLEREHVWAALRPKRAPERHRSGAIIAYQQQLAIQDLFAQLESMQSGDKLVVPRARVHELLKLADVPECSRDQAEKNVSSKQWLYICLLSLCVGGSRTACTRYAFSWRHQQRSVLGLVGWHSWGYPRRCKLPGACVRACASH